MKRENRKNVSMRALLFVLITTAGVGNAEWKEKEAFDQALQTNRSQSMREAIAPFFNRVELADLTEITRYAFKKAEQPQEREGVVKEAFRRVKAEEDFREKFKAAVGLVGAIETVYTERKSAASSSSVQGEGAGSGDLLGAMREELHDVWEIVEKRLRSLTGLKKGIPAGGVEGAPKAERVFIDREWVANRIAALDEKIGDFSYTLSHPVEDTPDALSNLEGTLFVMREERNFLEDFERSLMAQGSVEQSKGVSSSMIAWRNAVPADTIFPERVKPVIGAVYTPNYQELLGVFYKHAQALRKLMGLEEMAEGTERAVYGPIKFNGDGSSFAHTAAAMQALKDRNGKHLRQIVALREQIRKLQAQVAASASSSVASE